MHPDLTLAVPTYNQSGLLKIFLSRFDTFAPPWLLLLIIDDGSNDDTPLLLQAMGRPGRIECHRIEHAGAAAARNEAFALCKTAWLAFTDTDCMLDAEYFEVLATLPNRYPNAIAVEGAITAPCEPKTPLTHWLQNERGGTYATANMLFKVATARLTGGFDTGFPSNLREDTDFGLTLVEQFGQIPFCREWKVHHPYVYRSFSRAWKASWVRQGEIVFAELRLYAKHPKTYKKVRRFSDAQQTLKWWQCWHAAFYARIFAPWLLQSIRQKPQNALRILTPYLAALVLAVYEQICFNLHCWRMRQPRLSP